MLGRVLDRGVFWPLPGWLSSYRPSFEFQSFLFSDMEVWYLPGVVNGPTVVFCHGNSGNLRFPKARGERLKALQQTGAHVWAFDYRGYGKSGGRPSEASVYEDAQAVHALARRHHQEGSPFVIFGRSLGGAVATFLAVEVQQPDLLILESTFISAAEVCATYLNAFLASKMSYRFDSASRIASLKSPLRFIHGSSDRVVPYQLGQKLYQLYQGSDREFVTVFGAGHNNVQQKAGSAYAETLRRWLTLA